jgi:hypothetical protein
VSAGSAGLVIDGKQTVQLPADGLVPTAATSQAILTIGSSTITAILATRSGNAIVVDGTTLSQGGSPITIDGTQVSAGTDGLVVNGAQTVRISKFEAVPTAAAASQAVLTVGGSTITATAASGLDAAIVIDGTTLSPGGLAITVNGTKLSAGSAGLVVEGTRTIQLSALNSAPTSTNAWQTVLTLGDSTITAILSSGSGNAVVVNGTTLSPGGPAITKDGTRLSAGTAGLVVGDTSTIVHKTTADGPQATEGAGTGSSDAPSATDADNALETTQSESGGQHTSRLQREWFCILFGSWILLSISWDRQ